MATTDDFSADLSTTGLLQPGAAVAGKFEVAGDSDWIKFQAVMGMHYRFDARAAPGMGIVTPDAVAIRDASGKVVQTYAWSFDPGVAGDYYLDATGLTVGSYTIASTVSADDYSNNNSTSGQLSPGAQQRGMIDFSGDTDRFKVTLQGGEYYSFSIDTAGKYMSINLRDATGAALEQSFPLYGGTSPALIVHPMITGDYFLDVSDYDYATGAVASLPYTVSLSAPVHDVVGDVPAAATALQLSTTVHGTMQGRGDVDVYRMALLAGTTYAVELASADGSAHYLDLNISRLDGKVLETASYDKVGYYTFTPAVSGDYFAAVKTGGGVPVNYGYRLGVSQPVDDYGATSAGAGRLTVGASVNGVLETGGGDRDLFAIDLSAGNTYWFSSAVRESWVYGGTVRLLNGAGSELASSTGSNTGVFADTISYRAIQSGTYYLEVSTTQRWSGSYTIAAALGVRDDVGNTAASATALGSAAPFAGTLEIGSDRDVFKLSVVEGRTYALQTLGVANGPTPSVQLNNAQGTWLDWATQTGNYTTQFTAVTTGDIYAVVRSGSDYAPVKYSIRQFDYGVDDFVASTVTKGALPMGGSLTGNLSSGLDTDWIGVQLEAGRSYVFQMLGAASGGGTLGASGAPYFNVTDPGNLSSARPLALRNSVEDRVAFTPDKTGTYYLVVGDYSYTMAGGSYTVKALQLSGDATGPALTASSHPAGATGIALTDTRVELTFSEAITIDDSALSVTNSLGVTTLLYAYSDGLRVSDNHLTIQLREYLSPGTYTLNVPHTAIHDLAGNQHSGPERITFTTKAGARSGTAGDDVFSGSAPGSGGTGLQLDGGAGIDTVRYGESPYAYQIQRSGGSVTVTSWQQGTTRNDTLTNIERLLFDNTATALDIDGTGGQAYRLYQAAFNRVPDQAGLGFWMALMDKGMSLKEAAGFFVTSPEFTGLYGAAPSDASFVNQMYNNVLHRNGEASGVKFWLDAMQQGLARQDVLAYFSESPENQAALIGLIGNGFNYIPHA